MADSLSLDEFEATIGGKQPKLPTIEDVKKAAVARGINPDFAASILGQESGGNWKTRDSAKGARGGMQVMPATFKAMMGDDGNPDDPWDNMEAGLRYIDYGRKKLGTDDPRLLAAGYHQGYDRPELKRGVIADTTDGAKRTRDYANEIAARMGIGEAAAADVPANPAGKMMREWEAQGLSASGSTGGAPAPVPVDGPKDDGKGAVSRNLGYLGDNLKIGWNTLANAYDGLLAGQYAEIYEANKATHGEAPTDPAMAANQAELKANYDAHMARVAQRSQESAQMQAEGRPETRQFLADAKDKPFLEQAAQLGDALVKNPVGVITDLGVQSAPASIAMMATAVAARFGFRSVPAAMAGGGAASATVEFGNDYAQQRAEGKSHEDAWTSASIKSGVVGLFDAASMGTAGKALDEVLKVGFGGKLKTIGKELGTQAALGGAGEGLGSLAAGDTPSLSAVAAEAVGEMFSAPGEALTTFRGKKQDAAAPADTGALPAADVLGTLTPPNPEARPATPGAGSQAPTASGGGDAGVAPGQGGGAPDPNAALAKPIAGDTLARVDAIDARLAAVTDPQEAAALTQERASLTANWPPMVLGRAAPFATETGANLDAQYAIVDAGSLTASHDTNLRQNPAYPQELQPRDRERAASEVQISGIVQKLAPQRLGASGDAANGAPIVGADGLVESGNARTIALQRVYQANGAKAQSYRDWLVANADAFGFTSDQVVGIEKPVLVRVRRTPVNRAEFARQANAPTTAVMSTVEQARSDAARLQNLDDLETDESGDFTGAGNRGFVRRFVSGLATTEQAGLVGADGQLSQSGYARIRNAVLARAYGDSPVLQRMVESLDNNLRGITGALMRVAPQVAKARDSIAAGALFDRDITENLLGAVEELSRLRTEGRSVAEYLAQAGMFGDALAPETADLLAFLDANIRSPKRIAEFLRAYLDVLASAGNPNQDTLFGGGEAPPKQDIINLAKERAKREQDRGSVPDGARGAAGADAGGAANDDAGGAEGGASGDRTGTEGRARLSRKAGSPPGSRPDEVTPAAPSSEGVVVSGDTITIDGVEYDATIEGFGQVDPPRTLADDDPLLTDTSTIDTPERRSLRDRIVDSFFVGATPVEGRKPVLYLMGGGGGSGKGTIKKRLHAAGIIPESGLVDLDADEIKVHHIPEYAKIVAAGDSRAAATVHEESSAIAKRVQRRALEDGYDLIVDGTMSDAAKANALMELARNAGYEVALFGVTVDPRAAIVRAGKRAQRSGRYVPAAALLKAHKGFASIFGELLAAADWGAVFDNTGATPRLIARKKSGSQNPAVVNDSAYNEVVGYGGLNEQANRLADVIRPEARRDDGRPGRVEEGQGGGRGRGDRAGQGEPGSGREAGDGGVPSERLDPAEAFRAALAELGDWVRNHLPAGTVLRMFDEDADPNLTGILVRLFEAAARLGYDKFERARGHVLKQLRASPATKVLANKLTDGALRQAHTQANAKAGGTRGNEVPDNRGAGAEVPGAKPVPRPQATRQAGRVRGGLGGPDLFSGSGSGGESAPGATTGRPPADGTGAGPEQRTGAGGGGGAGRAPRVSKRRPVNAKTGRNWRAGDTDLTYEGSWLQKAQQNLDAVRLLRRLEDEERQATPEEQRVLAKYVGWGASDIRNKVFTTKSWELTGAWKALRDELRGLLTDEQWNDASRSTQYAHYTDASIVRGMWRALGRLGFAGGTVLEPGAGIGVFPGLMPAEMASQSIYTGIEFESLTGGILRQLFPDERVLVESFIDSQLPRDFYDIAAGNPPFSGTPILADPEYRKQRFLLHDYFFAKTIDRVRPGGLVAFVTSHGTLDKRGDKARTWMAERADLVGAIRLPQTAFQKNAGTEVVTDVIFLRKKVKGEEWAGAQPWTDVAEVTTPEGPALINEYFVAHPEMVLGTHSLQGTMYGKNEYTVLPRTDAGKLEDQFSAAVDRLPENVMSTAGDPASKDIQKNRMDWDPKAKKENAYYLADDGTLMQTRNSVGTPVPIRQGKVTKGFFPKHIAILKSYVPLRDALKQAQLDQLADGPWEASLKALQKEYRAFVAKHGRINQFTVYETENEVEDEQGNVTVEKTERLRYSLHSVINDDPEWTLVAALEKVDEEKGTVTDGAFLTDRVLAPPKRSEIQTPGDALLASLNDYGRIDIPSMADSLHMDEDAVIESLGSAIYEDPAKGWQTSDDYLSGDVVEKLAVATEAARNDKRFERNVEALNAVQPRTITHDQITANIGQNWIPAETYAQFMAERLGIRGTVRYVPATGAWFVKADNYARSDFGTARMPASEILDDTLNAKPLQVWDTEKDGTRTLNKAETEAAIEKAGAMRAEFRSWLWSDATRAGELQDAYNQRFNRLVPRKFDGTHLTLPGTSIKWKVHPHVKRGAWRIVQEGNTYLAHAVGAGKTFASIISAMEQKRLGLISKPMFVVPNHMLQQFSREFLDLYPQAQIMVADEREFHTDRRRAFVSRAALTNLDGIVITHSAFKLLDLDPEFKAQFVEDQLEDLRATLMDMAGRTQAERNGKGKTVYSRDPTIRNVEQAVERLEQRLFEMTRKGAKDQNARFDQMGVDMLYVDEAHEYRKLDYTTARQVKGIDPKGSEKSFDLYMKSRWLEAKHPGRSLVMMSGTPITNTMAEMYTVMRFLDADTLKARGMEKFDAWAANFGEEVTALEADAGGKYQQVTRFARFENVPELARMFRRFADVLTGQELGRLLPDTRPKVQGGGRNVVITPLTPEYKEIREKLRERMKTSREWKPSFQQPNNPDPIIAILGDGKLAAIDHRFLEPWAPDNPQSKLNILIDAVIKAHRDTADMVFNDKAGKPEPIKGATQMVFADAGFGAGVAARRGFDGRAWFTKRLKAAGIPLDQVAFMSDYKKSSEKLKLFAAMNGGKVRILVGSSKSMGTGVNAQQRLLDLHHMDSPWFPADLEQREGRIVRQGNKNPNVRLHAYAMKGTYDETMWGMVARKQRFIDQALSGDDSVRQIEDVSEASQMEQIAALTSGDPRALELAGLNVEIERLYRLYTAHESDQTRLRADLRTAKSKIEWLEKRLAAVGPVAARVQDLSGDAFRIKLGGETFEKRADAGAALAARFKELRDAFHDKRVAVGEVSGFPLKYIGTITEHAGQKSFESEIYLDFGDNVGGVTVMVNPEADAVGVMRSIGFALENMRRSPGPLESDIAKWRAEIKDIEPRMGAKFQFAETLAEKYRAREALEADMAANASPDEDEPPPPPQGALLSRNADTSPAPAGLSVSRLRAGISKILAGAKRLPAGGVQVVQSVEDLPEGLRDFLRSENAESEVEGIYDPASKTVWLVADHLPTAERAEQVLFHELYGHFGLQGLFGKGLSAALRDLVARNKNLRVAAAKMRMEHGYDEDIANEEALVELAERGESLEGLRRFVAAMQKALRELGFERLADWMEGLTDAEAMTVIAEARRFVRGQTADETQAADTEQARAAGVMSRKASPGNSGSARPGSSNVGKNQASDSIDQQADAILAKKRGRFTPLETLTKLAVKATLLDRVTSGLYDRLLGLINRITPETVKAGVVSDYGVPEAVIDRRIQMQGAVKAHYRQVGEIIAALGNLTRAESRVAYQWMNSDDPQSSDHFLQQLPAESVAVLADVEKWIDKLSADAVKLGLLTQEVRDRHRFAYLRRSYLKHEEEATAQEKTRRRRAISVLGDQYKGRGIVDGAPMRKIENVAPTWWKRKLQGTSADKALRGEQFLRLEKRSGITQATTPLPGMPAGAPKRRLLDVVYWPAGEPVPAAYAAWEQAGTWEVRTVKGADAVMWRDFTAQEREQMGEIDEVKYAVARTLHGMIHDVEAAQYLKWVSDKHSRATAAGIPKEKIVDATESLRTAYAPDQWVQVPDTTIKGTGGVTRYGALAGRYIPAPVWNDIRQSIGPQQMVLGEWYQNILRAWKVSKTALSPTVHVNNVMANFVMADWHDVRAPHIAKALEILVRSKDPAHRRIIDRFEDAGGTIGTWSLSELQREQLEPLLAQLKAQVSGGNGLVGAGAAIQLALSGKWREAASAAAGSKGAVATAAVAKAMIDLYQAEDVVFRMAAFIKAKEEGATDEAAAKVARKSFLDYQINAPWIQLMRQTAFPFVAFTYRAVPMLLETMAKRPWKLLKMGIVLGGVNALGYALSGGDEDKERKLLPEEKAGKAYGFVAPKLLRMPWNDDNDSPVFLDIRRWIPVGDVLDAGQTHSAIPILPVAVPAGPLAVFAEIAFNQSQFTGREITKATDTGVVASIANLDVERMGLEQESKVFDHLFKAFAPNIAFIPGTYAFTGLRNAATGRTDSFGREQSVAQAVASSVGVKLGSYPSDVLLLNETRKRDGALREIQENITGLKREFIRQGIGTEEYRKKLAEQQAKMQKVNRDFAERVQ